MPRKVFGSHRWQDRSRRHVWAVMRGTLGDPGASPRRRCVSTAAAGVRDLNRGGDKRNRTLVPILMLSLLPAASAHAAVSASPEALAMEPPRVASAGAVASTPRAADVGGFDRPGTTLRLTAQCISMPPRIVLASISASPAVTRVCLWARVWFGERTDSGCTREMVLQGTSEHTSSWSAHEADGTPISVVANHSKDATDSHLLRLQLDRPNLPNGCARAEWWEGTDAGPTTRIARGPWRRTFRLNRFSESGLPTANFVALGRDLLQHHHTPGVRVGAVHPRGTFSVAWSATRGDGQVRTRRLVGLLERRASPDRTSCNPRQAVGCTRHPEAHDHGSRDHTHQMDQALDPAPPTHKLGRLALRDTAVAPEDRCVDWPSGAAHHDVRRRRVGAPRRR